MTLSQLRAIAKQWQANLRLQDWEIKVRWMTKAEKAGEYLNANGFCGWNEQHKFANVVIDRDGEHIESTVIHELLHILWEGNLPLEKTGSNLTHKEIAINTLAELLAK